MRSGLGGSSTVTIYLAVVPAYRREAFKILRHHFGSRLRIFASPAHLDPSVKTGVPSEWYTSVRLVRLLRSVYFQFPHWGRALSSDVLVIDLNPRGLSVWALLVLRRIEGKRTVLWGHLLGRSGRSTGVAATLRRSMRRLASGFIAYTYGSANSARMSIPSQPVWVAPNALYSRSEIETEYSRQTRYPSNGRNALIYVGRLEEDKHVDRAVRGLAACIKEGLDLHLLLVGGGSQESRVRQLAEDLLIGSRVEFFSWRYDQAALSEVYGRAFCAISPGFIGLNLTQAHSFGVPMLAVREAEHSPEVELGFQGLRWFDAGDEQSFVAGVRAYMMQSAKLPDRGLSDYIANCYSSDVMASGIISAIEEC